MKTKILILTILLMISLSLNAFAATLGYINYWYNCESSSIARWAFTPYTWGAVVDNSFTSSAFGSYVNHAVAEWSGAGISTEGEDEESDANIRIYGGSFYNLHLMEPQLSVKDAGLTAISYSYEGEWIKSSTTYIGNQISGPVKVYIVYASGKGPNHYKNVATHEFGHSLGWLGHSASSSDVMYYKSSTDTSLSSRDENHLNQIY